MKRSSTGGTWARIDRTRRRLGWDGNDLRREIDRRQWAVGAALMLLFLAIAPFTAAKIAEGTYRSQLAAESHERAARHQVLATAVEQVRHDLVIGSRSVRNTVKVTWQDPGGPTRTAMAPAWPKAVPGSTGRIWVDAAGHPTTAPRPHFRTISNAVLTGGWILLGIGGPILLVYALTRRRFDRRRYATWDTEWKRINDKQNT